MGFFNKTKKIKQVEKKAFLFAMEPGLSTVMHSICDAFGVPDSGPGNQFRLSDQTMQIHGVICAADISDDMKKYVDGQIENVWNHYHETDTASIDIKINLLHQFRSTGSVTEITYSYEETRKSDPEMTILRPFMSCLPVLKGVLLVESGSVVLDGEGRVILTDEGDSGLEYFMPFEQELPEQFLTAGTKESRDRRNRSMEILRKRHIYAPAWLPVIETEDEAVIPPAKMIAGRAAALLAVSLYSECLLGEGMKPDEAYDFASTVLERFDAFDALSPSEQAYLKNPSSTEQEQIHYSWQYENLFVMEWALGLTDTLPFPDTICDVPLTVSLLNNFESMDDLLAHTKVRSAAELLDEDDLIFRLDWACVDARVQGLPAPGGMDGGITVERHKSLNWLIGYDDGAPWDEVDTPT